MVLNEPENSLHPDLVAPLGQLPLDLVRSTQLWVISHSPTLIEQLRRSSACVSLELEKELGETRIGNLSPLELPPWSWR